MNYRTTLAGIGLLVAMFAVSTGSEERWRMETQQDGWRSISVGAILTFRVPAVARERAGQPIDSLAGLVEGPGYEITYDYGRFSERVEAHRGRPGYSISDGRVGSRRMQQVSFRDIENNPNLPFVRMMRVEDGANALTLRVSCFNEGTCTFADTVFNSVEFS